MLRYRSGRCAAARELRQDTKFYAVGVMRTGLRRIQGQKQSPGGQRPALRERRNAIITIPAARPNVTRIP